MDNHKIIKSLESTSSRIDKENIILNEMRSQNDVFFKGMELAYNKLLTFGVKKIPESNEDGISLSWEEFSFLSEKLIHRKLTGYAMR